MRYSVLHAGIDGIFGRRLALSVDPPGWLFEYPTVSEFQNPSKCWALLGLSFPIYKSFISLSAK